MVGMMSAAFLIGLAIAIPPGAITVGTIQRTLTRGIGSSLMFNLGVAVVDVFYMLLVYAGLSLLFAESRSAQFILFLFSGGFLIFLGLGSLRSRAKHVAVDTISTSRSLWRNLGAGVFLNLLNPLSVVGWVALAGNFLTTWRGDWPPQETFGWVALLIMIAGAFSWMMALTFMINRLKRLFRMSQLNTMSMFSGMLLVLYGISAWVAAIQLMIS